MLHPAERVSAARATLALGKVDPADPASDAVTFGSWLTAHGQSQRAIAGLFDLIGVATLNLPAAEATLSLAAKVFRTGLIEDPSAGDLGWSRVPLGRLHSEATAAALAAAGVTVRRSARVRALDRTGEEWRLVLDTDSIAVDQVVLAVPPPAAEALLPGGGTHAPAGWAERLGASPIVNVHVRYDRPVTGHPFFAAVGSPVQWAFDRTEGSGAGTGQYLAVSLSAAGREVDERAADVVGEIVPALAALLPAAREATVLDSWVTRERTATFRQAPGSAALRPPADSGVPGIALAGAWTDTGWPATMESAVRYCRPRRAAETLLGAAGRSGGGTETAVAELVERPVPRCGRRWTGSSRAPGDRGIPLRLGGRRRPAAGPTSPAAARRAGRGWHCCPRGPPARRPRSGCPARSRSSCCTTSRSVHDDVMDGDLQRRHRRTVWAVFGVPAAILTGERAAALALEVVLDPPTPTGAAAADLLGATTRALIGGQFEDLAFEQRESVTVGRVPGHGRGQDRRPAVLQRGRRRGAGRRAGGHGRRAGRRTGERVGLAFQLEDDLLGIWGDPAVTGKPALADLRARKKSLPVAAALATGRHRRPPVARLAGDPGAAARPHHRRPGRAARDRRPISSPPTVSMSCTPSVATTPIPQRLIWRHFWPKWWL